MDGRFVMVFNKEAKRVLEEAGFVLLRSDEDNDIYAFASDEELIDKIQDVSYIQTDTMTY